MNLTSATLGPNDQKKRCLKFQKETPDTITPKEFVASRAKAGSFTCAKFKKPTKKANGSGTRRTRKKLKVLQKKQKINKF